MGGFHAKSSPPCWWTVNKRSLISSFCLSTSIFSFHHCYSCLPTLHENHLFKMSKMVTHNSISLFTNLFCKPKIAEKLRTQRLVQTEVKIPSTYLKSLGLLQQRMINENSKSESAYKNGSEKIPYPMRHYAFGRSYNHAIRNVSDLKLRYFVSCMQSPILPRPALILL